MLSSVYISGRLSEAVGENARIVEVDSPIPSTEGKFLVHRIPVICHMTRKSFFFVAPNGSLIVLKGRLESHPEWGLVVIDEIDEIYSTRSEVVKTVTQSE